eukprot:5343080-Amphidinium_carterae.1
MEPQQLLLVPTARPPSKPPARPSPPSKPPARPHIQAGQRHNLVRQNNETGNERKYLRPGSQVPCVVFSSGVGNRHQGTYSYLCAKSNLQSWNA